MSDLSAAWYRSRTPYMFPWSGMPPAGCPSSAAVGTKSWMRSAPSGMEYSVCRCRWTNELLTKCRRPPECVVHRAVDDLVDKSHVCDSPTLPDRSPSRTTPGAHQRHQHLGSGERPVRRHEMGLTGHRRVDERDAVVRGEHDVADPPAGRGRWTRTEPAAVEQLRLGQHPGLATERVGRGL